MLLVQANHRALKRAMRLALLTAFLIALLGTVEQAAQLCKATRFVGRHNGLLVRRLSMGPNRSRAPMTHA